MDTSRLDRGECTYLYDFRPLYLLICIIFQLTVAVESNSFLIVLSRNSTHFDKGAWQCSMVSNKYTVFKNARDFQLYKKFFTKEHSINQSESRTLLVYGEIALY